MNVAKIIVFALIALVLVVSPPTAQSGTPGAGQRGGQAAGQPGGQRFKWWQDEKMKTQLGLTAEQAARIEEVFQASMTTGRPVLEELDRREKQASALFLKSDTSEAEVLRQAELVENMRAELSKAHTLMLYRMNRILTPEQRVKFNEMNERRDRGRREPPPIKK